jgi:hypothetical protein
VTPRWRTTLVVSAPIVAVATLMLGLRVGASNAVRAASLVAARPGKPTAAGRPLAWQLMTYLEDRGVRETIAIRDITVIARSDGREARWTGATNADGIAEVSLHLDGDRIDVEVIAAGEPQPLAKGVVDVSSGAKPSVAPYPGVRPSRRDGLGVDLLVEGERLIVGFETPLWVHVQGKAPIGIKAEPEAGLRLSKEEASTACDGWAELPAYAEGHVSGIQIEAKDAEGHKGTWFGPLPVAAGAFFIDAPRVAFEGQPIAATLVAPNPRNVVYAEVDDEEGRVFAAALPLAVDADHPVPSARFEMPPLAKGLHWLVVSGEPRGAEHLSGATIAKPFLVGTSTDPDASRACSIGPWLAKRPAAGFPRWLAFDGMATRGVSNRSRHRAGLFIGLVSLLAAAILEVVLLTAASREARAVLLLADLDEPAAERQRVVAKPPGGGVVVAILVALLGFALLAALLIARA